MLSIADFKSKNIDLINSDQRIVLAYSGGLDSSVLMHLLSLTVNHNRILIWHINHQLQECAMKMEDFCDKQAQKYLLNFKSSRLDLSYLTNNIEAQAREARYNEFARLLNSQNDMLLTAHHADDQLETLLLNMCRGTGVSGLRGIGRKVIIKNMSTLRPLLFYSRSELHDYAEINSILWFEDPTNVLSCFDRNYIRHQIAPHFKNRWTSVNQSFQQVANHQSEAADCLEELALIDYKYCSNSNRFSKVPILNLNRLKEQSLARQKNVIRYWLKLNFNSITMQQLDSAIKVISTYDCGYKQIQIKNAFIGLFSDELFYVEKHEIKEKYEVENWFKTHKGNYHCRIIKQDQSVSSHFYKRQFQSKKIPPWLRDQVVFVLDEENSKHNLEIIVL